MLEDLLVERRTAILERWRRVIRGSYPADAAAFIRDEKNRFANPVGHVIADSSEAVLDGLIQGWGTRDLPSALEELIQIRAVQSFAPSDAISFLFSLKMIVREVAGPEIAVRDLELEILEFERRVDAVALKAFDFYARCRERVHEIRLSERARCHSHAPRVSGAAAPDRGSGTDTD